MAKCRMVDTRFWDDAYITNLNPNEKLLFLYFLTNPQTTIAGVYEITEKRIAFDTGLGKSEITAALQKFTKDKKIIYEAPWLAVVNFVKHQSLNPKVVKGITIALQAAPTHIVDQLSLPARIRIGVVSDCPPTFRRKESNHSGW